MTPTAHTSRDAEHQQAGSRRRLWQTGAAIVAILVLVATVVLVVDDPRAVTLKPGQPPAGADGIGQRFRGIAQHGIVLGRADAPVTVAEFFDPQCPYCRRHVERVLPDLIARYVRTGRVRITIRPLGAIGADSERLARVVLAAGHQDRAWQAIDLLLRNQGPENSGYATDAFIRQVLAPIPDLRIDRVLTDARSAVVGQELDQSVADAKQAGLQGVPSTYVGTTGRELARIKTFRATTSEYSGPIDHAIQVARNPPAPATGPTP